MPMRSYRLGREKALHFVRYRRNPAIAGEIVANPEADPTADLTAICTIGGSDGTISLDLSEGWRGQNSASYRG
jgi:hypothetical protein